MTTKALRNKAVLAVAIIGTLVLLYVLTSSGSDSGSSNETKKHQVDTSKCETAAITLDDIKLHNKCSLRDFETNDWWIAVNGYVFDVSSWIISHPGGDAICSAAGDSSQLFKRNHADADYLFKEMMKVKYCVGKLVIEA